MNNEWKYTGETETGLKIWVQQVIIENEKYLRYKYTNSDNIMVDTDHMIPFKQVKLLNSLVECLEMENGI